MKLKLPLKLAALVTAAIASLTPISPGSTSTFEEQEVDQNHFEAVAFPFGDSKYNLWLIEQIPGKNLCWSESGSNPVMVELLLMNFDFTGHCRRSTDSNGYSIRMDGEDYGLDYILRIVPHNGELLLVGTPRNDRSKPELTVGRTYGLAQGFVKIILEPGWKFSRRAYQGKSLGHIYFSYVGGSAPPLTNPLPQEPTTPTTEPSTNVPNPNDQTLPGVIDITKPSAPN
jgi:hypothetical protein